ncbi:CaiB/BaiF CoA transferase family protein [Croceicoccus marinus]|uniref:Formyl-CoA transferase n=1 Tax=Croceicoccus marinus TaxID=450378 RepID=A0A1Z1FGI2_9SPHN|nr:CoA transferase [Croceicoccus marinus]ARU17845.1 formyl-CoA transferase [Croceicoccus marinus]
MNQPLAGITIADFSHVMAGPYATHLLCMLGADVIKIEAKGGDNFRNYGADRRFDGMSPAFIAANAGKKSIALDLKEDGDAAIAQRIVARCDVVVENFRPGVMARLNLGYDQVRAANPDVIYCSISGYGQDSPQRDWPAIDNIVQATSGMMLLSGSETDDPVRVGFPIVDTLTGQSAAIAILSAVVRRQNGGGGSHIDVAMFDAALAFMTSALTPFMVTGQSMPRMGNTGYSGLPTASLFTARDGREISLGVVQPNQFAALARFLDRLDWLEDPRFATPDARRKNFDAMTRELAAVFAARDAADWETGLNAAGIPCGMVRKVEEAVALAGPDAMVTMAIEGIPGGDTVAIPGAGFRMTPDGPGTDRPPPRLDADRADILEWLDRD